jgi:aldose 1-epimerase
MAITSKEFGKNAEGAVVTQYTMTNKNGASVKMIDYGATITSICVPDKDGVLADVVLGFDDMTGYLKSHGHMGETIGRYGNRIARGEITLDGVTYQLAKNNGENHLHGGKVGFGVKMWETSTLEEQEQDTLIFHMVSPDGEENYPGTLDVTVTYTWTDSNALIIRYRATTDKTTLCNMTNHAYFNLAGHDHGTIRDQVLYIDADAITPVDAGLIPTGGYLPVTGTPFDLREGELVGDGLDMAAQVPQMVLAGNGYDHNYVLRKGSAMGLAACLHDEASGRTMEVITDQPGVQLYTDNTGDFEGGKGGAHYGNHAALCLETQHFPDSPHNPQWASTVLRPGEVYDTTTIYAFSVDA